MMKKFVTGVLMLCLAFTTIYANDKTPPEKKAWQKNFQAISTGIK